MSGLDSAPGRVARWGDWILVAVLLGAAQFEIWVRPLVDNDGTPLGFARWYRRWLDNAEAQVSPGLCA